MPPLHDDRHATAHRLAGAHDEAWLDGRLALDERARTQAHENFAHGLVVGGRDVLDRQLIVGVGRTVADPKVVHRDENDATRSVVLGLAVAGVSVEVQVEIAARIAAARQREHHGRCAGHAIRQEHRRRDVALPLRSLAHLDRDDDIR